MEPITESKLDQIVIDVTFSNKNSVALRDSMETLFENDYLKFVDHEINARQKFATTEIKMNSFNNSFRGQFVKLTTRKQIYFLTTLATIGVGTGLLTSVYESPLIGVSIIIATLVLSFVATCTIPQFFYSALRKKQKLERTLKTYQLELLNIEGITEVVDKGSLFILEYQKLIVKPDGPTIRKIFELFEEMKLLYIEKSKENERLEYKFQGLSNLIVNPIGKLILMDNISKIVYGEIISEWTTLKKSLSSYDESIFSKPVEPWISLGILSPAQSDYDEFVRRMDEVKEIQIDAVMMKIFKNALC
jgi:hypothetical protein